MNCLCNLFDSDTISAIIAFLIIYYLLTGCGYNGNGNGCGCGCNGNGNGNGCGCGCN